MSADLNFEQQVLNRISALVDVIGPLTNHISRLADDVGRSGTEFIKLNRKIDTLRDDLFDALKGEVAGLRG
jgi:peptidoglycan hydrolase CwlO-like protein